MSKSIINSLNQIKNDLQKLTENQQTIQQIEEASTLLSECFKSGGKVLACGNGGSMCDAMHLCEELSGRFRDNRKALPALSLSEPGYLTCVANDFGYENVFARGVEAFGSPKDTLIVFTTSGKSPNILNALKQAKKQNLKTIALVGKCDDEFEGLCDILIKTPGSSGYADRVQELHGIVIHLLIERVEQLV